MDKISVVIITLNEEKNIRAALDSAKWADEIVVVDSFSADGTLNICGEYTDRIFKEAWRGFSGQKSLAVSKATNDWVFVLDSDERITPELADEMRGLMAAGPDQNGYRVARLNHFMGRRILHGGWYPDYSVRLFDRRKGSFGERAVHEAVEVEGAAGTLRNHMLHFTYDSISDYLLRMDRYSTLAASEMNKAGRSAGPADMLIRPLFTFLKMFVLKQGIRDGMYGLIIALLYSAYTFSKYAKLWEMSQSRAEV